MPHRSLRRRAGAGLAALACAAGLASGCADAVTGGSDDAADEVRVVAEGSRCVHDRDMDDARFEVTLRNTGDEERTVRVTPLRRSEGREVGDALQSFVVSVPAGGEEDADYLVERAPDDLAACLVMIDDGDPVEIALEAPGG